MPGTEMLWAGRPNPKVASAQFPEMADAAVRISFSQACDNTAPPSLPARKRKPKANERMQSSRRISKPRNKKPVVGLSLTTGKYRNIFQILPVNVDISLTGDILSLFSSKWIPDIVIAIEIGLLFLRIPTGIRCVSIEIEAGDAPVVSYAVLPRIEPIRACEIQIAGCVRCSCRNLIATSVSKIN